MHIYICTHIRTFTFENILENHQVCEKRSLKSITHSCKSLPRSCSSGLALRIREIFCI